jgi:hypothetical protein
MKRNLFLIFGLLLFIYGCHKTENISASIPTDTITKLYLPNAYDFFDARPTDSRNTEPKVYSAVGYYLKTTYPAEATVSYYVERLKELGYQPYLESKWTNGKYNWQVFVKSDKGSASCNYQYFEDWINKDKTRLVNLAIQYHSLATNKNFNCAESPSNDLAEIIIISEPYEWRIK